MKYMHLYTKKKSKKKITDFKNTIFQNSSKFSQQYVKKRNKVFSRLFFRTLGVCCERICLG